MDKPKTYRQKMNAMLAALLAETESKPVIPNSCMSKVIGRPTRAERGMPLYYSPAVEDRKHNFVRRKFRIHQS